MTLISSGLFKIQPNTKINLSSFKTNHTYDLDKDKVKKETKKLYKTILELQEKLYAGKEKSLLVVLQAMDAAGKDSTIRKITTNLNVQGARVTSFGKPSKQELAHDFLWRVHNKAPQKGEIVFFNRSHYEDVLIVKVHKWCEASKLQRRYEHINNFEALLADNDTKVIKIMLHISPEYQLSRFKNRLENQEKNWKFNPNDLEERKHWVSYMQAFEDALQHCSTEQAPWYIVPAEERWFRDYIIAQIVHDTLVNMEPKYPEPDYDDKIHKASTIS